MNEPAAADKGATRLLIADWSTYGLLLDRGVWQFADDGSGARFRIGDRAAIYLTSRDGPFGAFAAIVKCTSPMRKKGAGPRHNVDHFYPHECDVQVIAKAKHPIPIKPLLPRLSFLPSGRSWGLGVRGPTGKRIPAADLRVIEVAIEASLAN